MTIDSGRGRFYGDEVTVLYAHCIPSAEIAPLVDEFGAHLFVVRTQRNLAHPMGQTYVDESAIALSFAALSVLAGFLEAIGMEAWSAVRQQLYRLYRRSQQGEGYRYIRAFSLHTTVDGVPVTLRITGDSMSDEQFQSALATARVAIASDALLRLEETCRPSGVSFILGWDSEMQMWRPTRLYERV